MKQKLFLMVLALEMLSISASAQTKEYQVEDDGFEWYKILQGSSYGALDKFESTIIEPKYINVSYQNGFFEVAKKENNTFCHGLTDVQGNLLVPEVYSLILVFGEGADKYIQVWDKNNYMGIYNIYGKCIIPVSRKYTRVFHSGEEEKNIHYVCQHTGEYYEYGIFSICDASGKVVFTTSNKYRSIALMRDNKSGKYALGVLTDHWFFVNLNEKTLWDPRCYTIHGSEFKIQKTKDGPWRNLNNQEKNRILFSADLLKGNRDYFAHTSEQNSQRAKQHEALNPSISATTKTNPSSSAGSSTSGSSSNTGNSTTTIHVEHHRDPVPVQEWVQCTACWGSGNCPDCAGSGTRYVGDNLRRCWRCGGRGRCSSCSGQGGRYYTVYK